MLLILDELIISAFFIVSLFLLKSSDPLWSWFPLLETGLHVVPYNVLFHKFLKPREHLWLSFPAFNLAAKCTLQWSWSEDFMCTLLLLKYYYLSNQNIRMKLRKTHAQEIKQLVQLAWKLKENNVHSVT